ncbi:hypothetical protein ACG7TL_006994 [Trametes sanguinea]
MYVPGHAVQPPESWPVAAGAATIHSELPNLVILSPTYRSRPPTKDAPVACPANGLSSMSSGMIHSPGQDTCTFHDWTEVSARRFAFSDVDVSRGAPAIDSGIDPAPPTRAQRAGQRATFACIPEETADYSSFL